MFYEWFMTSFRGLMFSPGLEFNLFGSVFAFACWLLVPFLVLLLLRRFFSFFGG